MTSKLYRINVSKWDRERKNNYRYYESKTSAIAAMAQLVNDPHKMYFVEEAEVEWKWSDLNG